MRCSIKRLTTGPYDCGGRWCSDCIPKGEVVDNWDGSQTVGTWEDNVSTFTEEDDPKAVAIFCFVLAIAVFVLAKFC